MSKKHGKKLQDDAQYQGLINKGISKEKAPSTANMPNSGKKGGKAGKYEERTGEWSGQAREVGIKGRSSISAMRRF